MLSLAVCSANFITQLVVLVILAWGVCTYVRLRRQLWNIKRRIMNMELDDIIDDLLEADSGAVAKHDTTYQRRAGPETTTRSVSVGGDWYEVSTAPRTSSCTSSWGPGPAISREGTVRRPGRQYGRWGGREALRPLRGSAWSSDDKNPGGSCASAIHLRGQHVSPNTPRRTAGATSRTWGWPLCWACGQ